MGRTKKSPTEMTEAYEWRGRTVVDTDGEKIGKRNHHRPHSAIGRQPPISRLTNLVGTYTLG